MTRLERSVRHELNYYGAKIRAGGHYYVCGYSTGDVPKEGYISRVCARFKDGICTDVTIYTVGSGYAPDDYYCRSNHLGTYIDITGEIESYIMNRMYDWNELIDSIVDSIRDSEDDEE